MALIPKAVRKFLGLERSEGIVRNAINEAFLLGGTYTKYDGNAPTYVREGYLYNPVVYAITKQRSDKASTIPFYIKELSDDNAQKKLTHVRKTLNNGYSPGQYIKELTLKNQAFGEDYMEFPMERPNILQTWEEVIALYETFMATTGNFYLYMLRGEVTGVPGAVYVLPSHLMKIVVRDDVSLRGVDSPIDSYMLIEGNQYVDFKAEDVIHVKLPNPDYDVDGRHLYGLSPLSSALRNLQSSNLGIDGNVKTMLNSGAFGFLHGKDSVWNEKQADQVKREMQRMDAGTQRLDRYGASTAALGWTQIGLTPQELELLGLLNFDQKQLANVLGWDDILLNNDQGAKYDNYELALKGVVTRTTMPSLSLLESALNDRFLPLFDGYENAMFMFDYSELPEMQPDMKSLVEWLNIGVANGAYTRDEFRQMTNFAVKETPAMEAHTVNQDIILLEEAIANDFAIDDISSPPKKKIKAGFDPNQPRDSQGRWTDTGSGDAADQYQGQHQMYYDPSFLVRLDDLTTTIDGSQQMFDESVYTNPEWYGNLADAATRESVRVIQSVRGNPNAIVTIYRGVPNFVENINDGDWVTLSPTYAQWHADSWVNDGHVISMDVRANTLVWNGDSLNEFAYFTRAANE